MKPRAVVLTDIGVYKGENMDAISPTKNSTKTGETLYNIQGYHYLILIQVTGRRVPDITSRTLLSGH